MGPVSEGGQPPRPSGLVRGRAAAARAGRWLSSTSYLTKWIVLGVVIGAVAGLGAIVFYEALSLCTHFFLGVLAGYQVPTPAGEGGRAASASFARPWLLPLIVGLGALVAGLLVFGVAPEAEGHGTDAAISAVHHNPRGLRFRAVVVKIVASALTIGSGGSGGREGPTAQISAGFGSLLARVLELEPGDSRVAVASGIGSGIGAIFGAPLGGAVLAAEILYRDDFDPTALLPCFIASAVSSVVFGAVEGFLAAVRLRWRLPLLRLLTTRLVCPDRHPRRAVGSAVRQGLLRHGRPLHALAAAALGRARDRRPAGRGHGPRRAAGAGHRVRLGAEGSGSRAADYPSVDRPAAAVRQDPRHGAVHRLGRLGRHLRPRHGHRCLSRCEPSGACSSRSCPPWATTQRPTW